MSKKTLTNESLSFRHICKTKFGANLETGHYKEFKKVWTASWDISCNQSKHGVLVTEKSKNCEVSDLQGNIRNDQFA